MIADSRSEEAAQIVRGLSTISRKAQLKIIAKKFPRRTSGANGSGFEREEHCLPPGQLPEQLPIPPGMDEFVITLEGMLDAAQSAVTLMAQVDDVMGKVRASTRWDSRTLFRSPVGHPLCYQITVFSDAFGTAPSA